MSLMRVMATLLRRNLVQVQVSRGDLNPQDNTIPSPKSSTPTPLENGCSNCETNYLDEGVGVPVNVLAPRRLQDNVHP